MTLIRIIFVSLAIVSWMESWSQTVVSGILDSNTTFSLASSPYLINDNLVVSQGVKLTIEPGVRIEVATGKYIEVRGLLSASGTTADSIIFTKVTNNESWAGIKVLNDHGANADFNFCIFSFSQSAINESCCGPGRITVHNSAFYNNFTAIGGYSGGDAIITTSKFKNNHQAITGADKNIANCTFQNNTFGLNSTERIDVSNSTFTGHAQAALYGGRGEINNCLITNNNVAVAGFFEGFTVRGSTITGNTKGIITGSYDGYTAPIENNRICNNTIYNIEHLTAKNLNVYGNCFCTSDSTVIESKLYDGLDDSGKGYLNYTIYMDDCQSVVEQVDKTLLDLHPTILLKSNSPYLFENDLIVPEGKTLTIEPGVVAHFGVGKKIEVRGKLNAIGTAADSIVFTSMVDDGKGSWVGIRVYNNQLAAADFAYCKFVNASSAITENCCGSGKVAVDHSRFVNNTYAMGGYSGGATSVRNSTFTDNSYCITGADKNIEYCTFERNMYGLYQTERVSVYNSVFKANTETALYGGRGTVGSTLITGNKVGIAAFFEGFTVTGSEISDNGRGIVTGAYDNYTAPITGNKICGNADFNFVHQSSVNFNAAGNCFCSADSTAIEAGIYDGLDNSNVGLVSYTIYQNDCNSVIRQVDKTLINLSPSILFKNQSPYFFNNDLIVFEGKTLTIEPGVKVFLAAGKKIVVRGSLKAIGTASDSIVFSSSSGSTKSSWGGIFVLNDRGASAEISYGILENASTALQENCCGSGKTTIKHSSFLNNMVALGGYTGNKSEISFCTFENNDIAATAADKKFQYCTFRNNKHGLFQTERMDVFNSIFTGHTETALYGGRGIVDNCIITNNKVGISAFFEGFTIKNSTVSNNSKGIITGSYDTYTAPIQSNKICHNSIYNIEHQSKTIMNAETNCFCTSDSTTVENKIFDGYDDSSRGLVSYSLFNNGCTYAYYRVAVSNNIKVKVDPLEIRITGMKGSLTLPEDSSYVFLRSDLVYEATNLFYDHEFFIQIQPGSNYQVRGDTLIPTPDYAGAIEVPIRFTDGQFYSKEYLASLTVLPVNDPFTVNGYRGDLTFSPEGRLEILPGNFSVDDIDNVFPDEFEVAIDPRPYYTVNNNHVILTGSSDPFEIPVTFSDGLNLKTYTLVAVTPIITGGEHHSAGFSISPNPFTHRLTASNATIVGIFDVAGRHLKPRALEEGVVDTSLLPPGIYIVKVQMPNGTQQFVRAIKIY